MVVDPQSPDSRNPVSSPKTGNSVDHRRLKLRLGSPSGRRRYFERVLFETADEGAHQSQGTTCSTVHPPKLGGILQRESGSFLARQPNGCRILIKARGNTFHLYDTDSHRHLLGLRLVRDLSVSDLHPRIFERDRRHGIQTGSNSKNRVAVVRRHFPVGLPKFSVGHTHFRFVRKQVQPPAKQVRFTLSGPECNPDGCADSTLAKRDLVRFSPSHDHGQSSSENTTGKTKTTSTHCTQIQQSNLVPICPTLEKPGEGNSTGQTVSDTTTLDLPTPDYTVTLLDTVAHQLPELKDEGYSKNVLGQLKLSRAKSTNQTYNSKWNLFAGYAEKTGFDPFKATAAQVADFLLHIFKTRHLKHSTVSAYRTAIGQVLWLSNDTNISNNRIITLLLKSFERQSLSQTKKLAKWDVGLVLKYWAESKNSNLDISLLTTKTVFLTALATGARRGELWALTNNIKQVQTNPLEVEIPFQPDFVTKTQFTRKDGQNYKCLRIPALSGLGQENICPVACLYSYRDCTSRLRQPSCSSLFVPLNPNTQKMTKQFISAHVIKAINTAFQIWV